MSKPDIWMPWFIGSYLADTMHLTTEQHGAYDLLLMHGWKNEGRIPDEDQQLAQITKLPISKWKSIRRVLRPFFTPIDDPMLGACWTQKRQVEEIAIATEKKTKAEEKARNAAQIRWGRKSDDAPSNAQALHEDCPLPTPDQDQENPPLTPPSGSPRKGRARRAKTLIGDEWTISQETLAWCETQRLPEPEYQRLLFINHFKAKGEARADWDASFRNWMLSPYRKDRNHGAHQPHRGGFESQAERNARAARENYGDFLSSGNGAG